MDSKKPIHFEEDPGVYFTATYETDGGPKERHYVDADIHGEALRRKVMASARAPERITTTKARRATRAGKDPIGGLRVGYSFWGFLGDIKMDSRGDRVSTPDGNATYSWSIVWEMMRRGHRVIPMMPDRDQPACDEYGVHNFAAFCQKQRTDVYKHLLESRYNYLEEGFPELDVLLLEWRFPIPGRNCQMGQLGESDPNFQPDLHRQTAMLRHYRNTKTKIIVWDLDYKLTGEDEMEWDLPLIIETSMAPRALYSPRRSVEPPTVVDALMEHKTTDASTMMAYIGSRYERDDVIDEWIRPIANRDMCRGRIHFYGNWMKDIKELRERWPGVSFHDRVTTSDFHSIYRPAGAVPLLAKREYMERGFVTPRIWEALQFGSIPVGLDGHTGISRYTPFVAKDTWDLGGIALGLKDLTLKERDQIRRNAIEKIAFMDVRHFVDVIEESV